MTPQTRHGCHVGRCLPAGEPLAQRPDRQVPSGSAAENFKRVDHLGEDPGTTSSKPSSCEPLEVVGVPQHHASLSELAFGCAQSPPAASRWP